jgi:hypothetical protein
MNKFAKMLIEDNECTVYIPVPDDYRWKQIQDRSSDFREFFMKKGANFVEYWGEFGRGVYIHVDETLEDEIRQYAGEII